MNLFKPSTWSWLQRRKAQRAAVALVPTGTFGLGIWGSNGTDQQVLLQETQGLPATTTRAIANRIAALELNAVARRSRGGTATDEILDDHPLKLLLDRPHPNFSRLQLLHLTTTWLVAVGEAYWVKVRSGFGLPVELHPVPPMMVTPIVASGNVLGSYSITDANGRTTEVPPEEMIRFWRPDPINPWSGLGSLAPAGIPADSHKFAGQHLRRYYQRDATPRTTIEAQPGAQGFASTEDKERFYALWDEHASWRNGRHAGMPAILPPGFQIKELGKGLYGAEVVPLLEYLRDDLLMAYGVPRSVLGQVVSGDRSSAETNQWVFDQYAVEPIACLISDALTQQLAPDFVQVTSSRVKLLVKFEEFISEDKEFCLKQEEQDLKLMVKTPNMVREDRGDDPIETGDDPIDYTGNAVPYDPTAAAERKNRPTQPAQQTSKPGAPGAPPAANAPEPPEPRLLTEVALRAALRDLSKKRRSRERGAA